VDYLLFELVTLTSAGAFYHFNHFGKVFSFTGLKCCYCFLCHEKYKLLDFFMNGHLSKDGIEFLHFQPVGGVFLILGGNVPRSARLTTCFVFCTL